ncbi:hypothetical protein MTP04_06020 [Lysinibacillus sp. PLM2]|nr:hypothetical protein MTP04_06020 [Lysinibacillus sp. PLM2]
MSILKLLAKIYFNKIEVKGAFPNSASFYISNHRNGAVDGFVILSIFKQKLISIIGKNLTNNAFMKCFFGGQIEIYRKPQNMEEMRHNRKELNRINTEIENGTSVLMFPEGTSHLNKGLLPIKKGVAHVYSSLKNQEIIPIGLHYEKGWSFRSNVFVQIGVPVKLSGETIDEKIEEIKNTLENVYDDEYTFAKPKKSILRSIIFSPIILLFFIFNLLVMCIPYFVGKKFADDKNVIALWRILSGVPVFLVQLLIYVCLGFAYPIFLVVYVIVTIVGLLIYRPWKDAIGLSNEGGKK